MSYLLQVRALERQALALQGQRPFLDEKAKLPTVDETLAEFEAWLNAVPQAGPARAVDAESAQLYELLGVGKGR